MGRVTVRTAHTADLPPATLTAARALLEDAFAGELAAEDWEHALGGVHALAWDGDDLVGHGAVVQRRLLHRGRALRTGYVEAVGVRAGRRRQGHGARIMEALDRVIRGAYELGALGATDAGVPLYTRFGWRPWRGPTSALTPDGVRRTPEDDDAVWVLPVTADLDVAATLICDWRDGAVW